MLAPPELPYSSQDVCIMFTYPTCASVGFSDKQYYFNQSREVSVYGYFKIAQ